MFKTIFRLNVLVLVGFYGLLIICMPVECSLQMPFLEGGEGIRNPCSKSIIFSHTEGKGLGYSQGYSSLDLFLAQPFCGVRFTPFVDLRGHVFNDGRFAANGGLGLRGLNLCDNRVWGINFFYDSLLSARLPYHQVSLGLEALGETWDVRVNGYLPIGRKKTPIYKLDYDFSSGFLARAREQFAMRGIDGELGYHFRKMQYFDLYAGLGPYFYFGRSEKTKNAFRAIRKNAIGGRLRASAAFLSYFELEGVTSYDSRFNWTGQVNLSLNIPFDWTYFGNQAEICTLDRVKERLFQPVKRSEIIVIDRIRRYSSNPAILDPENEP